MKLDKFEQEWVAKGGDLAYLVFLGTLSPKELEDETRRVEAEEQALDAKCLENEIGLRRSREEACRRWPESNRKYLDGLQRKGAAVDTIFAGLKET